MTGASPGGVSLDGMFRANVAARPEAIALIDPPDRARFTEGPPRRLTFAEADEWIERLSYRLATFGMPSGSVVAVQLPNIAEAIISLLAISRAGLVAAPAPTLWRRSDLVAALSSVAPRAMISLSRLGDDRPAEISCEAAAELFDLSFPCAFGTDVPDGVLALDADDALTGIRVPLPVQPTASAVSLVTFDADADGFFVAGRSDAQWLAAGLATFLEAKIVPGDTVITTLPPNSLAGISAALVPWLLSGGTLELIHGHSPEAVLASGAFGRSHFVSPAAALPEIATTRGTPFASCIAVHRASHGKVGDFSQIAADCVVDLNCFGEIATIALAREDARYARPIPAGGVAAPSTTAGSPIVIETRLDEGQLWLRGPMVPLRPFPVTADSFRLRQDRDGFVATGFPCRSVGNGEVIVGTGPERILSVGGLRFGLNDLQSRFSACAENIKVTVVDDALLGQRLRIEAADPNATIKAFHKAGHSRLVIDATVGAAIHAAV